MPHQSAASVFTVKTFGIGTIRSGLPMCQRSASSNWRGGGMSAGFPRGAPAAAHADNVSISRSVSDGSSLNCRMPTVRSTCQGGICRASTRCLIERAQGRASSYVSSDIGAIEPGRWQFWQDFWKIGATSLVNVTSADAVAAVSTSSARLSAAQREGFSRAVDKPHTRPPRAIIIAPRRKERQYAFRFPRDFPHHRGIGGRPDAEAQGAARAGQPPRPPGHVGLRPADAIRAPERASPARARSATRRPKSSRSSGSRPATRTTAAAAPRPTSSAPTTTSGGTSASASRSRRRWSSIRPTAACRR